MIPSKLLRLYSLLLPFLIGPNLLFAGHTDTSSINKSRLIPLVVSANAIYTGSLIYLSSVWYEKQDRTSFHFFNDLPEWKQMDKAGHLTTAFHEAFFIANALKWSGISEKKAYLLGGLAGFFYQAPIEWLDGYSKHYGASLSDLAANGVGAGLFIVQYLLWKELRIKPKFSFHPTKISGLRPAVLGNNLPEQILKDYNGQTYWLSTNISSFFPNSKFPAWINLSLGYGAHNLLFGRDQQNIESGFLPFRQYYLSFDIDFQHIPVKSRILKLLLYPLNIIHIPFPALEFNKNGVVFHPVYF